MLPDSFYTEFKKSHPKIYFVFPEIPFKDTFTFKKLTEQNFECLYLLFEGDASPFVDERFKTYEGAKEYAKFISLCGASIPKHGCQDWLFKCDNEFVGILHLYDMSLETFGQNHKRAWIGFATSAKFRSRHISFQVVRYFIQYIFDTYPGVDFIHAMTLNENENAAGFLTRCGFITDTEERLSKEYRFFINRRVGLS